MDARGLHGLTCKLASGRIARHQTLNDVVTRALVSAGIPATKEPVGLLRSDGKRPGVLTLVPWQSEKPLTWDVTVAHTHTLATSYVSSTAREAGAAAEMAATRKSSKYADLAHSHHFQPRDSGLHELFCDFLLSEFGPQNQPGVGDAREASYLYQRIAVTTQRICD